MPDGCLAQVIEGIFKAYFEQGKNLGSVDVLASVAKDAGLDEEQVKVPSSLVLLPSRLQRTHSHNKQTNKHRAI